MSFVDKLKPAVKRVTPAPLRRFARNYLAQRWDAKYEGRPVKEIFSAIYREGRWGTEGEFSSGSGSHHPAAVGPYLDAVRKFLRSQPYPPSAVDLGCGDFNIGKELRPYCSGYIACDVVPALIQSHKDRFAGMQVEFRCLDIIEDDLPAGDIVFLRQVLQHLNNSQILRVVQKLDRYKFLVVTEHLPSNSGFPPNRDKATGGGIRLSRGSGVVLSAAPFLFRAKSETIICTTTEPIGGHAGIISTILYEL
jgi:Methyltransferase domain